MTTKDSTILDTTAADLAFMSTHYYAAYGTQTWSIAAPSSTISTLVDSNGDPLPEWLRLQRLGQVRDAVIALLTGIFVPMALAIFIYRFAGGRYKHWTPTFVIAVYYWPFLLALLAFVFDFTTFWFRSMTCYPPDPDIATCTVTDLQDWLARFFSSGDMKGFRWYWSVFFVIGVLVLCFVVWTFTHLPADVRESEITREKRKRMDEKLRVVHKEVY